MITNTCFITVMLVIRLMFNENKKAKKAGHLCCHGLRKCWLQISFVLYWNFSILMREILSSIWQCPHCMSRELSESLSMKVTRSQRYWTPIADKFWETSFLHFHYQDTKWGNMVWNNHPSCRVPRDQYRISEAALASAVTAFLRCFQQVSQAGTSTYCRLKEKLNSTLH